MIYTNTSSFTGKTHSMALNINLEDFQRGLGLRAGGALIQDAFPQLNADEREFIMTGATPDEWNELHGRPAGPLAKPSEPEEDKTARPMNELELMLVNDWLDEDNLNDGGSLCENALRHGFIGEEGLPGCRTFYVICGDGIDVLVTGSIRFDKIVGHTVSLMELGTINPLALCIHNLAS